jgi:hypothetical protein
MPKRIELDCNHSIPVDQRSSLVSHLPTSSQIISLKRSIKKQNAFSYQYDTVLSMKEFILTKWVETKSDYDKLGIIWYYLY